MRTRCIIHCTALLYDAPGPHPDDQACQAKAQKQFGGAWAQGPQAAPPNCFLGWVMIGFGSGFGTDFFDLFLILKILLWRIPKVH